MTATAIATQPGVHPAARNLLDAIREVAGYEPTSPQDAAALLLSLGGDGTGVINAVSDLLEAMTTVAATTRRLHPEATAAAVYAEEATAHVHATYQDSSSGEFAIGQAVTVLEAPHVAVMPFREQFALILNPADDNNQED